MNFANYELLIFLDFDGVLNSDPFFIGCRLDENGMRRKEFDYSKSLLPVVQEAEADWLKRIDTEHEASMQFKAYSFLRNISKKNFYTFMEYINELDSVGIVLSTSWRNGLCLDSWNVLFSKIPGWKVPIVGITPSIGEDVIIPKVSIEDINKRTSCRGDEIKSFLETSKYTGKYLILDDDGDMLEEQKPFFIQTNRKRGFTVGNVKMIKEKLYDYSRS